MSIEVLTNGCGVSKEYKDSFANVDITSTSSSQISVTFNTLPEYISSMRFETVEMTNSSTANLLLLFKATVEVDRPSSGTVGFGGYGYLYTSFQSAPIVKCGICSLQIRNNNNGTYTMIIEGLKYVGGDIITFPIKSTYKERARIWLYGYDNI